MGKLPASSRALLLLTLGLAILHLKRGGHHGNRDAAAGPKICRRLRSSPAFCGGDTQKPAPPGSAENGDPSIQTTRSGRQSPSTGIVPFLSSIKSMVASSFSFPSTATASENAGRVGVKRSLDVIPGRQPKPSNERSGENKEICFPSSPKRARLARLLMMQRCQNTVDESKSGAAGALDKAHKSTTPGGGAGMAPPRWEAYHKYPAITSTMMRVRKMMMGEMVKPTDDSSRNKRVYHGQEVDATVADRAQSRSLMIRDKVLRDAVQTSIPPKSTTPLSPQLMMATMMRRLGGGTVNPLDELHSVDFRINECKTQILDLRSQLYHYLEELSRLQRRRNEILASAPPEMSPQPPRMPLPPYQPEPGVVTLESKVARQRAAPGRLPRLPGPRNHTEFMKRQNRSLSREDGERNPFEEYFGDDLNAFNGSTGSGDMDIEYNENNETLPRSLERRPAARVGNDSELSEFAKLVLSPNLHNMSVEENRASPPRPGENGTSIAANQNGSASSVEQVFPGIRMLDDLFQNYMDWDMPRLQETAARATTPGPEDSNASRNQSATKPKTGGRPRKETLGRISAASLHMLREKLAGEIIVLEDPTDGVMASGEASSEKTKPWSDLGRLRDIVRREGPTGAAARAYHGGRYYVQLLEQRGIPPGRRGDEVQEVKRQAGFRPDFEPVEAEADFHKPTFKTANYWKMIYLTLAAYPRLANYFKLFGVTRAYKEFPQLRRELDSLRKVVDNGLASRDDEELLDFYRDEGGDGAEAYTHKPTRRERKKKPNSKKLTVQSDEDVDAEEEDENEEDYVPPK